jgi:hypothetical protein
MINKRWYESKTVWVNAIAFIAALLQVIYGKEVINAGVQGIMLTLINIILRAITKHNITWKGENE